MRRAKTVPARNPTKKTNPVQPSGEIQCISVGKDERRQYTVFAGNTPLYTLDLTRPAGKSWEDVELLMLDFLQSLLEPTDELRIVQAVPPSRQG